MRVIHGPPRPLRERAGVRVICGTAAYHTGTADKQRHNPTVSNSDICPRYPPGGATPLTTPRTALCTFQSTPPHGGATQAQPRRESDAQFQSTPPHGGATWSPSAATASGEFQSTPPHGGATLLYFPAGLRSRVSIHAPARGGDRTRPTRRPGANRFNPRPRTGGRRMLRRIPNTLRLFQSTPPHRGGDDDQYFGRDHEPVSIHAPARGGDGGLQSLYEAERVSIHAPARGGDYKPPPTNTT